MIHVEDLVFSYDTGPRLAAPETDGDDTASHAPNAGDNPALDGITLSISDGSFVVVAGPNGSGKSTLVRHFNGLLTPDSGKIRVEGVDPTADPVAARTAVGMVFQHPRDQLVAATVGEDVAFGPENLGLSHEEIEDRVTDALAAVNMTGRRGERVTNLSGGEQARVALAGVLAMEPTHLVLDEPFVGLDETARRSVLSHVRDRHDAGTSVIVVAHDLRDILSLADRVIVLSEGHVAFDGDTETARERLPELGVRLPETR
jgi:biotin transport system ATP-binding protein